MPRPERPLDQDNTELARFAEDLRALRIRAGRPAYRVLAGRAHYSATTLSDAAGGRQLPSLSVTLGYVRACGGDAADWERRWHTLACQLQPPATSEPTHQETAPYVGLATFEPSDADRFFGRTDVTTTLVERVRAERLVWIPAHVLGFCITPIPHCRATVFGGCQGGKDALTTPKNC